MAIKRMARKGNDIDKEIMSMDAKKQKAYASAFAKANSDANRIPPKKRGK